MLNTIPAMTIVVVRSRGLQLGEDANTGPVRGRK